jgi:hypothetical protein
MFLFRKHGRRYAKTRPKSAVICFGTKKHREFLGILDLPDKIGGFLQGVGRNMEESNNCHGDIMILFTMVPDIHQVRRLWPVVILCLKTGTL